MALKKHEAIIKMGYLSTFADSFEGDWEHSYKTIIKCKQCKQKLRVPLDRGEVQVSCPKCNRLFWYSPYLLLKKIFGFFLLIIGGILFGALIGYLNHLYDITGFYLFFIIPWGAILFAALANIGFFAILAFIRMKGVTYSKLLLLLVLGLIALYAFWRSEYLSYANAFYPNNYISHVTLGLIRHDKAEKEQTEYSVQNIINFKKYVEKKYSIVSFRFFGRFGKAAFLAQSDEIEIGFVGIIFIFLKHIGLIFIFPIFWKITGG